MFNEDFLEKTATRVRQAFLDNGIPPTEEVIKIAAEHDLNIEQIKRVCEESNKAIKLATKKNDPQFEFPLADFAVVIEDVQRKVALHVTDKTASVNDEPEEAEPEMKKEALDMFGRPIPKDRYSMNGATRSVYDGVKTALANIQKSMDKTDAEIDKVAAEILDRLNDEALKFNSINRSYSALVKAASTDLARNRIFALYKFAKDSINKFSSYPVIFDEIALSTIGENEKVASVISAGHPMVSAMNRYLNLMGEMDKLAAQKSIHKERLGKAFAVSYIVED